MPQKILNPHDHFFKAIFARQETALNFIQNYLPAEIVETLDLTNFEISKDTFVDGNLKEHFSDILYQVGLQTSGSTCIYILFEHKSYRIKQLLFNCYDIWLIFGIINKTKSKPLSQFCL